VQEWATWVGHIGELGEPLHTLGCPAIPQPLLVVVVMLEPEVVVRWWVHSVVRGGSMRFAQRPHIPAVVVYQLK
jgi:hypothetical protein